MNCDECGWDVDTDDEGCCAYCGNPSEDIEPDILDNGFHEEVHPDDLLTPEGVYLYDDKENV